jgi:hypothetical protein
MCIEVQAFLRSYDRLHDHPFPPPLPSVSWTSDTEKTEKESQRADGRDRKRRRWAWSRESLALYKYSILSGAVLTRFLQKEEMPAFLISPPSWKRRKVNTLRQITSLNFFIMDFSVGNTRFKQLVIS